MLIVLSPDCKRSKCCNYTVLAHCCAGTHVRPRTSMPTYTHALQIARSDRLRDGRKEGGREGEGKGWEGPGRGGVGRGGVGREVSEYFGIAVHSQELRVACVRKELKFGIVHVFRVICSAAVLVEHEVVDRHSLRQRVQCLARGNVSAQPRVR